MNPMLPVREPWLQRKAQNSPCAAGSWPGQVAEKILKVPAQILKKWKNPRNVALADPYRLRWTEKMGKTSQTPRLLLSGCLHLLLSSPLLLWRILFIKSHKSGTESLYNLLCHKASALTSAVVSWSPPRACTKCQVRTSNAPGTGPASPYQQYESFS